MGIQILIPLALHRLSIIDHESDTSDTEIRASSIGRMDAKDAILSP